jgi:hypothetical protein
MMTQRSAVLRRWLFDSVSVVLLILCLILITLRIRGGNSGLFCWARPGGNMYCVQSLGDRLVMGSFGPWPCSEHRWNSDLFYVGKTESEPVRQRVMGMDTFLSEGSVAVDPDGRVPWTLGGRGVAVQSVTVRSRSVVVPFWLLMALFSPLPVLWMVSLIGRLKHHRRMRLSDRTHCYVCGYNLTGNASGVCPECGSKLRALQAGIPGPSNPS